MNSIGSSFNIFKKFLQKISFINSKVRKDQKGNLYYNNGKICDIVKISACFSHSCTSLVYGVHVSKKHALIGKRLR